MKPRAANDDRATVIDKLHASCSTAVADIPDSAIVMIGGFGTPTGSDTEMSGRKETCEIARRLYVCDQPIRTLPLKRGDP